MSSNIKQTVIFIGYYLITMITYYAVHASHNNNQCTYETKQDKIINIQESKRLGANLLEALQMNSLADCTAACCDQFYGKCNMAFYHETNKEEKNCFLALCDPEEKCVLTTLKGFAATTIFQPEVPSKDKSFLTTLLNELEEEFEKEGAHSSSNPPPASNILKFHPFLFPSHNPIQLHRQKRNHIPGHVDPGDNNANSSPLTSSTLISAPSTEKTVAATASVSSSAISPLQQSANPAINASQLTNSLIATSSKTLSTALPSIFKLPTTTSAAPHMTTTAPTTTVSTAATTTSTTTSASTTSTTTSATTTSAPAPPPPPTAPHTYAATTPDNTPIISEASVQPTVEKQQKTDLSSPEVGGQSVNNISAKSPSVDLIMSPKVTPGVAVTVLPNSLLVTQKPMQTQKQANPLLNILKPTTQSRGPISTLSPTAVHITAKHITTPSPLQPTNAKALSFNSLPVDNVSSNVPSNNSIPVVGIGSINAPAPPTNLIPETSVGSNAATINSPNVTSTQTNNPALVISSNIFGSGTSTSNSEKKTTSIVPPIPPTPSHTTTNTPTKVAASNSQNAPENRVAALGVQLTNSVTPSTTSHNASLLNATQAANSIGGVTHVNGVEQLGLEDSGIKAHSTSPLNFSPRPRIVSTNTHATGIVTTGI
ncbi:uncharacterized protein [Amphiura filiformis]|uniref:uncharacterized protein isoform X1 n=1 Tax=Amphiura filiformis TaxID=82378 RepID=UPI003B21C8DF